MIYGAFSEELRTVFSPDRQDCPSPNSVAVMEAIKEQHAEL